MYHKIQSINTKKNDNQKTNLVMALSINQKTPSRMRRL